jgi:hypothetical protein
MNRFVCFVVFSNRARRNEDPFPSDSAENGLTTAGIEHAGEGFVTNAHR